MHVSRYISSRLGRRAHEELDLHKKCKSKKNKKIQKIRNDKEEGL